MKKENKNVDKKKQQQKTLVQTQQHASNMTVLMKY